MDLGVECYAGYRAEETPRRLLLADRRVWVEEVLERWRTPEGSGFRCRGDDGVLYILVHDDGSGRWTAATCAASSRSRFKEQGSGVAHRAPWMP